MLRGVRDERVRCSRLKREIENYKKIEFDLRFAVTDREESSVYTERNRERETEEGKER